MFVIGVTGGIGSGKSAVTNEFAKLGIDVVDADVASRIVVEPGTPALKQIAAHFGATILLPDHSLDRAALRKIIFNNADEKRWLEQLLHPLIAIEIQRQLNATLSPYAIFVSPLLIEAKQSVFCDRILVVDVPEEIQLHRTVQRDNNDADQVRRIIASQASRAQRLQHADYVIENTGSLKQLRDRVKELHALYLQLAANATGAIS